MLVLCKGNSASVQFFDCDDCNIMEMEIIYSTVLCVKCTGALLGCADDLSPLRTNNEHFI